MMKKLFSLLVIIILSITFNVYALEDTMTIKSDGDKLTYETNLIHTNDFILRDTMLPGETYNDALKIENKSSKSFSLYFKLDPKGSSDLLNSLEVNIKLDGNTVYSGDISGAKNSSNPNSAILLKRLEPNQTTYLTIKTTVSDNYTNKNNTSSSQVDLKFYAMYGNPGDNPGSGDNPSNPSNPDNPSNPSNPTDPTTPTNPSSGGGSMQEITPIPKTGINISNPVALTLSSAIIILLGIGLLITLVKIDREKGEENEIRE